VLRSLEAEAGEAVAEEAAEESEVAAETEPRKPEADVATKSTDEKAVGVEPEAGEVSEPNPTGEVTEDDPWNEPPPQEVAAAGPVIDT